MKNLTAFYITLLMASLLCFTPAISAQAQFVLPLFVQLEKMSAMESTSNILFLGLQAAGTIPTFWDQTGYLSQYPIFGYLWIDPLRSNLGIINVLINPNFVTGINGWQSYVVTLQAEGNGLFCIVDVGPQITQSQFPFISPGMNIEDNIMQLQMSNPIGNVVPTVAASFIIIPQPSPTCSTGLSMGIISVVS
ncbi:MAG: hypothetical protein WBL67_12980 [Nitrososphaeraceae archaeon]